MDDFHFKVNLSGMIKILSDHLYSSPEVYIRELLQNGVDAISGRQKKEPGFSNGAITIRVKEGFSLTFTDNGLGLTEDEIHRFLAVIGESSKTGIYPEELPVDYIGRFGIGLLSCFMVSDEIRVTTRSVTSAASYEWIGKPDGTYQIRELSENPAVGTSVSLICKAGAEEYFRMDEIKYLVQYYGLLLPYPITLISDGVKETIYPAHLPWEGNNADREELLFFGSYIFHENFLDCIVLHSDAGSVSGVAYVVPYRVQAATKQEHRVYLKNMLLTEQAGNFLPDWAVFVKCIINAHDLRPTASRESFYEDELLAQTREDLGNCILSYLKELAVARDHRFYQFLNVHDLIIKSMAIEQDDLFRLFIDYLDFSTTRGRKTGYELRTCGEPLMYADTMDKYKQLSQIFFAKGKLLINACYVYSLDLLYRMEDMFETEVLPAELDDVAQLMGDLTLQEEDQTFDFIRKAKQIMKNHNCGVEVKKFSPPNQPVFYYLDDETKLHRQIAQAKEHGDAMFHNMLDSFLNDTVKTQEAMLIFNYDNPIFKKLLFLKNREQFENVLEILYVQALLIGGFPLCNDELTLMNSRLLRLLEQSEL